mgnify:CR=1 FL=1
MGPFVWRAVYPGPGGRLLAVLALRQLADRAVLLPGPGQQPTEAGIHRHVGDVVGGQRAGGSAGDRADQIHPRRQRREAGRRLAVDRVSERSHRLGCWPTRYAVCIARGFVEHNDCQHCGRIAGYV